VVSRPFRQANPDGHQHYDALLQRDQLEQEIRSSGFTLTETHGVQRRYPVLAGLQVLVAPRSRLLARGAMDFVHRRATRDDRPARYRVALSA
jgi:hypothetical protein